MRKTLRARSKMKCISLSRALRNFAPALALPVLLSTCSWLYPIPSSQPGEADTSFSSEAPLPPNSTPVATPPPSSDKNFIEVVWEIPEEKVESYTIRYGTNEENLDHEVILQPLSIQKITHPKYGEVYRYLLPNPPKNETVYLSISAVSSQGESAPSKVFAIAPSEDSSLK